MLSSSVIVLPCTAYKGKGQADRFEGLTMQIFSSYPHPDFGHIEYPMMMANGVGGPAVAPRN